MNTYWVRADLKARGKAAFKRNYWPCVLAAIIGAILGGGSGQTVSSSGSSGIQSAYLDSAGNLNLNLSSQIMAGVLMAVFGALIIALILNIFVFQPLYSGVSRFFLVNSREKARLGEILYAFKNGNYWNVVKTRFLTDLFLVLWTCLFIVPGIIKMYSYRMVPYILAENPQMSTREIIDQSRQMMDGNKWRAFVLDISFIGWYLLSALTLGIVGVFYASPYIMATNAELYLAISGRGGVDSDFFDYSDGGSSNEPHYQDDYASLGSLFNDFKEEEKDAGSDNSDDDIFRNGDSGHSGTKLNGKEI